MDDKQLRKERLRRELLKQFDLLDDDKDPSPLSITILGPKWYDLKWWLKERMRKNKTNVTIVEDVSEAYFTGVKIGGYLAYRDTLNYINKEE